MENKTSMMHEIKSWEEKSPGIFSFPVRNHVSYEIHILYHDRRTELLTANASLYIVENHSLDIRRTCVVPSDTFQSCIEKAVCVFLSSQS